jgi:SSS family solute:Na+ symporter
MVLPGVMAGMFLPELENADAVFPTLVTTLLPAGLVGLVMAGLLAAIMSSIDSTLNSAATLLTMDFLRPERRGWSAMTVARVGRVFIILFMLLAAAVAPMIENFSGLFHYLQSALAYLVPPVAVIFILGLFWRRASAAGAFATLLGGHVISAVLFACSILDILSLHFTIIAGLLALISAVIFVLASLKSSAPSRRQIEQFTFHQQSVQRQASLAWWQDYRLHSLLLLLLTTVLVIVHW